MTSRFSSKNKGKPAKRKNSVTKQRSSGKKNGTTRKQKTASPGVEPGLSARASNSFTTAPQWHT